MPPEWTKLDSRDATRLTRMKFAVLRIIARVLDEAEEDSPANGRAPFGTVVWVVAMMIEPVGEVVVGDGVEGAANVARDCHVRALRIIDVSLLVVLSCRGEFARIVASWAEARSRGADHFAAALLANLGDKFLCHFSFSFFCLK